MALPIIVILSACLFDESNAQTKSKLQVTASYVFKDKGSAVVRLAEAAARGDRQAVAKLVQQGADVNALGDLDTSVLQWAFWNQSIDGMQALLKAGADPALIDNKGMTVMHYAAAIDDPSLLQGLLDAGVSTEVRDPKGQTPLHEAIWNRREPQLRILLGAGADPNAQAITGEGMLETGSRPLHLAASLNDVKGILALLEAGADPRALNGRGRTFQSYLNTMDESIATDSFVAGKRKIEAWLVKHGVELERKP
ncbi:hypothetical protein AXE65_11010 [Ventosimonas gracilis]|uniref:Uncharacterized protein n=2 Tax=Ventosimonas gracilis TaxID=1680762 RepID=A0A139SWG6_9GAMM|nr:hypothetical protein AXE65_11010 [Ventosimonas gracilis]